MAAYGLFIHLALLCGSRAAGSQHEWHLYQLLGGLLDAVHRVLLHNMQNCIMSWAAVQQHLLSVGVRYPAHLLPNVVAMLSSLQQQASLMQQQQLLVAAQMQQQQPGAGSSASAAAVAAAPLQGELLAAAAAGAGAQLRMEPVSPVDKKSLAKAMR